MNTVMSAGARFRALFDATYPSVGRYVRHRGLSGQDAEDLVAATYEVAWRRLDAVPIGEQALLERLPAPENAPQPLEPSIVTWRNIREALDTLAADDRELVLLVAWDGLSPAQAGGVLGLTPVAARSRLHRARAKLAETLDAEQRPAPTGHEPGERTSLRRSGA
jgi:RNA polymerase sigma-70 factor (ECF subfamily)